jgi:hypothetical protein
VQPSFLSRALESGREAPETACVLSLLQRLPDDVVRSHILPQVFAPVKTLAANYSE